MQMTERYYLTNEIEKAIKREEFNRDRAEEGTRAQTLAAGKISGLQEAMSFVHSIPFT